MFRKLLFTCLCVLTLLAFVQTARAGGWSVVTLDEVPSNMVAGEPLTVGFMVRQHGKTPMAGLTPHLKLTHAETQATVLVDAKAEGEVGHYVATVILPEAGQWRWTIDAFGPEPQPMPELAVEKSVAVPVVSSAPAVNGLMVVGLVVILSALGGGVLALVYTRKRWVAVGAVGVALVIGLALVLASLSGSTPSASATVKEAPLTSGEALFVAKGCVMCHTHAVIADKGMATYGFAIGPDLTKFSAAPDYLRTWLKDPQSIKPNTEMPQLYLKEQEIEVLVAFLSK